MLDVWLGRSDDHVEIETNVGAREPGRVIRRKTYGVVSRVMGGECESALTGAFRFHYRFAAFQLLLNDGS